MKQNVRERVLKAALRLFAQYGYYGVTIRDLAEGAETNLHGVYRAFGDKDGAFDAALHRILDQSLSPARLALLVLEDKKKREPRALIEKATRKWYQALSEEAARILFYAYLSGNRRWANPAGDYLGQITEVLARSMEIHLTGQGKGFNPATAAKALVYSLFLFKVMEGSSKSKTEQMQGVAGIIELWFRGLG